MLLMLNFRINIPTSLDFALFFAHRTFAESDAQNLVQNCIPWLYWVGLNYDIGRGLKPSSVALAALCHVVQASDAQNNLENRNMLFQGLEDKKELMQQAEQILQVFHCDANLY